MLLYQRVLQLLCLIGESFDEASEDVCGAVVNVRPKGDKISIWTGNCQNRDAIMTIGWVAFLFFYFFFNTEVLHNQ